MASSADPSAGRSPPVLLRPTTPLPQHREHFVDGRKVDAKAAVPRDQGGGKLTRKMFVGGMGELPDDAFRAHFAPFGTIVVRGWPGG